MNAIKAGIVYFAVAFGAGVVLGVFRVTWLVPHLGPRVAELLELPVMLIVSFLAARGIARRRRVSPTALERLRMGACALLLLLVAEVMLVERLRGLTFREYLETRDPVSGIAYAVTLILFALMPWWIAIRRIGQSHRDPS